MSTATSAIDPAPGTPLRTSALAVWSLVLGILGLFTCLPAVPALLLGIIGLVKIRPENGLKGKGMAAAGVAMGSIAIILAPLVATLSMPAYTVAVEKARQTSSMHNVKQLITAMRLYAFDHNGAFANDWETLLKETGMEQDRDLLTSPLGEKPYQLLLQDGKESLPADTPFILDPNPAHNKYVVGFVGGEVRIVKAAELEGLGIRL